MIALLCNTYGNGHGHDNGNGHGYGWNSGDGYVQNYGDGDGSGRRCMNNGGDEWGNGYCNDYIHSWANPLLQLYMTKREYILAILGN